MKKLPGRKKKGIKRKTLIKKLDTYFSQYIRWSHADSRGHVKCVKCSTVKHVKEMQNGHFMSRRHYSTRWLFANCGPQCYSCNIGNQGRQYEYSKYIDHIYGKGTAQLIADRSNTIKRYTDEELKTLAEYYKNKVDEYIYKHS